jgi:hypothetical protein
MVWTAPMTAVNGAILTAAQWNTHVRDNLLETAPAKVSASGQLIVSNGPNSLVARSPASAYVTAVEGTTSTSFTDLATYGPEVSVLTGNSAMIFTATILAQTTVNAYAVQSYEISGATTSSPGSATGLNFRAGASNQQFRGTYVDLLTGLTPGVNTFTMKYQALSGGTASFGQRIIFVLPFS